MLFRCHPSVKGSFCGVAPGKNRLYLVCFFEGIPLDRQAVPGLGGIPVGPIAIGIDMVKITSFPHIKSSLAGSTRESCVPNELRPFLGGMSADQSRHLAFGGRTSVLWTFLWKDSLLGMDTTTAGGKSKDSHPISPVSEKVHSSLILNPRVYGLWRHWSCRVELRWRERFFQLPFRRGKWCRLRCRLILL